MATLKLINKRITVYNHVGKRLRWKESKKYQETKDKDLYWLVFRTIVPHIRNISLTQIAPRVYKNII